MNDGLIKNFRILCKHYDKIKDKWRAKTYKAVLKILKDFPTEITDVSQLKGITGVGKSSLLKIREYLDVGQISKVEEIKKIQKAEGHTVEKEKILEDFHKVWGIGQAKAEILWKDGIRSMDELTKQQKIVLTEQQQIGLKYYDEFQKSVPRKYIDILQMAIRYVLSTEFGMDSYKLQITGSYRRGKTESGDIDCLVTSEHFDLKQMITILKHWDIVTDTLSIGPVVFMGVVHCPSKKLPHIRLDVKFVSEDNWGSVLLHFTGSKANNINMSTQALKLGLTLNKYGLFKGSKRLPVFTEREIFEELGMKYLEPHER